MRLDHLLSKDVEVFLKIYCLFLSVLLNKNIQKRKRNVEVRDKYEKLLNLTSDLGPLTSKIWAHSSDG